MIDFASIKTTPCGKVCHYFGKRTGADSVALHCYGIWTEHGVFEWCYDDEGRRLLWVQGKWIVQADIKPIAPPSKRKVWAYILRDTSSGCRFMWLSDLGPTPYDKYDFCQVVEVP